MKASLVESVFTRRGPFTVLLAAIGATLALLSVIIGVDKVTYDFPGPRGPSEIGFLSAPNWSLTSVFVWPAMYYTLSTLIEGADRLFNDIDASPMAWSRGEGEPSIGDTWQAHKVVLGRLLVLFVAMGLVASGWEWWESSVNGLILGSPPLEREFDWSSVRAGATPIGWWAQAAFSLLAFAYQAAALTMMAMFAAFTILVAHTVSLHASGKAAPPLLIDIESNDPDSRGGFERFVFIIDYMIVFVSLGFTNFFLTRIQNAYLRDPDPHHSIAEFIRQDFFVRDLKEVDKLFAIGTLDFSSLAVTIGALIVLFQCFFFFNATLRHSAIQARNRSDHVLIEERLLAKAAATGIDRTAIRERLRSTNVWPLGYSDLMPTLSFLTICLVTIIFFRIGFYLTFLWIAGWILTRTAGSLLKRS